MDDEQGDERDDHECPQADQDADRLSSLGQRLRSAGCDLSSIGVTDVGLLDDPRCHGYLAGVDVPGV